MFKAASVDTESGFPDWAKYLLRENYVNLKLQTVGGPLPLFRNKIVTVL